MRFFKLPKDYGKPVNKLIERSRTLSESKEPKDSGKFYILFSLHSNKTKEDRFTTD